MQGSPQAFECRLCLAGLCGLTRAQAVSLDKRVRVNAILPGWIVNSDSLEVSDKDRDWHLVGEQPFALGPFAHAAAADTQGHRVLMLRRGA